jgi:hypothetical protein
MKSKFMSILIGMSLLFSSNAKASIFGEENIVLAQILANAIQQLAQLKSILDNGQDSLSLLRDVNRGINDSLYLIKTISPNTNPGLYKDWEKSI